MSIFSDKFDQLKKADKAVKSPKYLQEVMGIGRIAENGIFEVGKGIYSKTYRFLDILVNGTSYTTPLLPHQVQSSLPLRFPYGLPSFSPR